MKLTVYGGERHRSGDAFAADALLDLYGRHRVATSGLLRRPLIALERVEVCKRDGALLTPPHGVPGSDERELVTSELVAALSARHAGGERGGLRLALG